VQPKGSPGGKDALTVMNAYKLRLLNGLMVPAFYEGSQAPNCNDLAGYQPAKRRSTAWSCDFGRQIEGINVASSFAAHSAHARQ
jgi:hypothetical protein